MRFTLVAAILTLGACGNDPETPPTPSSTDPVYYGQVQAILDRNCVECHSASPDRLAPFSLASYDDAVAAAEAQPIVFDLMNRAMPPYYAVNDGTCGEFTSKWLTDDEMTTLSAWINGAHTEGDPAQAATPPVALPDLPRVDRTLDIGGSYTPDSTLTDDYRCFVVDPIGANKFLTAVHIRPGNLTVAHHVIVYALADEQTEDAVVAADAAAPGLGYPCPGGPADTGVEFLAGWAPGNEAVFFPTDTGIPVNGARKLVVQMHYNLASSDGQPDRTTVDLLLEDQVAKRAQMFPVRGNVNLAPHDPDAIATGSQKLPNVIPTGRLWGEAFHMHTRGTKGGLTIDHADSPCLLDLDHWSFHWQHMYWYEKPVTVNAGDTITITCHYDTSADSAPVTWGEKTTDEMCLAFLYISQ